LKLIQLVILSPVVDLDESGLKSILAGLGLGITLTPRMKDLGLDSNLRIVDSDPEFHQQVLFRVHFLVTIHQYVEDTRLTVDETSNQSDSDPQTEIYRAPT